VSDYLKPSVPLLCKLASAMVHVDEFFSADGHPLDRIALQALLDDPEVRAWLDEMSAASLTPQRRTPT
jgi:hypothetical protein